MPQPQKSDPAKSCLACGKPMLRKRINGILQDRTTFLRGKYCDRSCMAKGMVKEIVTKAAERQRARKFKSFSCASCGTLQKLQVHHKDRNTSNNDPSNLETMCATCHMKMHHANGDIVKRVPKPPCVICGKKSYRQSLCNTCLGRKRRYGTPYLRGVKHGSKWILIPVDGPK